MTNVDYRKLRDVDTQLLDEYLVDALDGQATSPSIVVVKALVSGCARSVNLAIGDH